MFNADFFPTPDDVIAQMLYGTDIDRKVILEPSGGKGNVVDYLLQNGAKEVISCEKNVDLKKILQSKCKVIADDFLTVTSDMISHIDCIIGNPPFSADDKHILHAYQIAPAGCTIIMLCNYETYRNSYSKTRLELKTIIEQYGSIENLGNCFEDSERSTGVKVGLIRIKKAGEQSSEFDGFFMEEEIELQANGIMPYNVIRDLVNRYVGAIKLFDEQLVLGEKMNDLTESYFSGKLSFSCTKAGSPVLKNDFRKDLQKEAWHWVFSKMNMQKYTTKGLKEDINKFVEKQSEIPFTMKNIYLMIDIVIGTTASRMDRAIIEVFDKLTSHYDENRLNIEGWKTNSHYLVNEKFILPWMTETKYSGGMGLKSSNNSDIIEDMMKALCYITGNNYDKMESLWSFFHKVTPETKHLSSYQQVPVRYEFGKWYEYGFFEIKGYKKGTMHFKFKNQDTWAIFNQNVARIKGYPLFEGGIKKEAKKAA